MTEQQWLSSDDPAAMLNMAVNKSMSDAALRLWVEACRGASDLEGVWDLDNPDSLASAVDEWCRMWSANHKCPMPLRAHLLREIVGNPWRPVKLPVCCPLCGSGETGWWNGATGVMECRQAVAGAPCMGDVSCPWLTPLVVRLARAAAWRECGGCKGRGMFIDISSPDGFSPQRCEACKAAGRVEAAVMDPADLAELSDALVEAGCDCEELLMHLRGRGPAKHCHRCGNSGKVKVGSCDYSAWHTCDWCKGERWAALPGPHPRGCWAIRLLTGGAP